MVADLCDLEHDELNEWEAKFVDDIARMLDRDLGVSVKQVETIKKLWERECK